MGNFNYQFTCPQIDRNIGMFKDVMEDSLKDFASELCPFLGVSHDLDKLINDWVDHIYSECEGIFEDVRSSNEDIRKEAERVIEELVDEIDDLRHEIKEVGL